MILWSNFKRVFLKPSNIIMMLVVPIVLNLVVITLLNQPSKYNVLLLCYEETMLTEAIQSRFDEEFSVEYAEDFEKAEQAVLNGYADYLVVIPEGMTKAAVGGEIIAQTYFRQDDDSLKPVQVFIEGYFAALRQFGMAADGNETVFYGTLTEFNRQYFAAEYKYCGGVSGTSVDNAISSLGYVAVGMVYFITFATMLLFEDKKCGVFERLACSPMSRFSYFFQHLFSYLLFAVVQIVAVIMLIPLLVDVEYGRDFAQIFKVFLICTAFAAACISIGIMVSSFSQSVMMANGIISMINAPMLMLGGCFWPQSIMPEGIQKVGNMMPTTWFLKASACIMRGDPLSDYVHWMVLLMGLTLALLTISFVLTTTGLRKYKGEGER